VDVTDADFAQNTYYDMSYHLGHTEEDTEVKKAVDEAQEYYDAQDKCKGNPGSMSEQLSLKI
jgi:hypothetical protein